VRPPRRVCCCDPADTRIENTLPSDLDDITDTGTFRKRLKSVVSKTGVKRELLDTVKARKLAYYGHTMRKQGSCLEKEIMQGTVPGARRRERPCTAWMDNIKTWTGLSVEEPIRTTEDRDKWRKYVHGVANRRIEDG